MKPHALITNDDGIQSAFLHRLVEALLPNFRISVAAPAFEQSWTGRCMTRHGEVEVIHCPAQFPETVNAWAISGTPSDCVNIALGNLLTEKPDIVLSGINIGYNTTETLILSSGTVAGAIEGVLWDLPAMAFSKCVPNHLFDSIRDAKGQASEEFNTSLKTAATQAARMAQQVLQTQETHIGSVINVNFPAITKHDTPIVDTFPAKLQLGSLFTETSPGKYNFCYSDGQVIDPHPQSDRAVLDSGRISRSLLNFSRIGQPHE
ncbi:5'/3'-nucleotidase SurE [Coraliomargarita sp. SDUM461004]|uniref:5'-nucleotidase n=1 Tax=Thalassobacterium sedimentorum TaxID=3041258 RepID=A0ABU1AG84_9BACT|nr:5'/3'-nucleotidase SurE [Coraliomargarita sp. SDUM461004]MDQ8193594.1 5'/3'-nucleotidase SurE [Coraliomargarita sp. SDUM461004]